MISISTVVFFKIERQCEKERERPKAMCDYMYLCASVLER